MIRVLAISDEALDQGYRNGFAALEPDVIVACGDLPNDYLDHVMSSLSIPMVWVPGNHDVESRLPQRDAVDALMNPPEKGPGGGIPADGHIVEVAGLRIAGLGGAPRYNRGPHQYTESQMRRRVRRLELKARWAAFRGRPIDVMITHSPPLGLGDGDDPAHRGFASFKRLIEVIRPRFFVHGHVHPYGPRPPDLIIGTTTIVNAVGYRLLEVPGR